MFCVGIPMAKRICSPDYEYGERIQKAAKLIRKHALDVMLVVQYGRLDNRQTNLVYYTTLAYAE